MINRLRCLIGRHVWKQFPDPELSPNAKPDVLFLYCVNCPCCWIKER